MLSVEEARLLSLEEQKDVDVVMVLKVRFQLKAAGEYELADKLRLFLETKGVLIEDGKRVVYVKDTVEKFREEEKKIKEGGKRFLSWLNGIYKKDGHPLETYRSFFGNA